MGDSYRKTYEIGLDEIDFNGHLHNTRYLDHSMNVRYSQMVEQGWDLRRLSEVGVAPVALRDELAYHREIRLGHRITAVYQITGYSADGSRWRARVEILGHDGGLSATVTTFGAWLGLKSRKIEAPPAELVASTEAIRSADFEVL